MIGIMPTQTLVVDAPAAVDQCTLDRNAPEQRATQRNQLNLAACVSVVGTPDQVLHGQIRNLSEGGTQIGLDRPLPLLTLVKIEYDDNLLLGETVYCHQEQSSWLVGVCVEHGLFGLAALADAMKGF